ncbi:MAG TPA: 4-vinyl reductase, partial [Nitrososphaerales archaeon]|nr:4-vinyl reductase [Nitrososphaerales archaeon]
TNSPLVRGVTAKEPRCWFVRGFAEGLISEILRTEVVAVETECMAAGASHCDFRIRWTESGQK